MEVEMAGWGMDTSQGAAAIDYQSSRAPPKLANTGILFVSPKIVIAFFLQWNLYRIC